MDGVDEIRGGIIVGSVDVETAADDGFAGELESRLGMNHADPGIVTAGPEKLDAFRNEVGTPGDFNDDIGGVGGNQIPGRVEGRDASHGRNPSETFRIAVDHDDPTPTGGVEQGGAVQAEEAGALDDDGVLRGGQIPEDGDHGGERAIGRGGHGIRDGVGKGDDGGAGAEEDVGGVTTVET